MLGAEGLRVTELERTAEGRLELGDLEVGKYRELNKADIV
jgi:16S rRNA U516 pseudouridylate synthase RsuA-like enzyme